MTPEAVALTAMERAARRQATEALSRLDKLIRALEEEKCQWT